MKKILTRRRVKVAHGERTLADNSKSFNLKFPITCPTALDTDFFCSVFKFSAFFFLSICQLFCFILWEDWGLRTLLERNFFSFRILSVYFSIPLVSQEGVLSTLLQDHSFFKGMFWVEIIKEWFGSYKEMEFYKWQFLPDLRLYLLIYFCL